MLYFFFRWELVGGVANVTAGHCSLTTDRMLRFKCVTHLSLCFGLFRLMLRPPLLTLRPPFSCNDTNHGRPTSTPAPPHKTSTVLIIPVHKDHKGCWRSTGISKTNDSANDLKFPKMNFEETHLHQKNQPYLLVSARAFLPTPSMTRCSKRTTGAWL